MVRERVIDVSGLEAPEPFRVAIRAVHELAEGEYLCMRHRREPFPLYETLARIGFSHRVQKGEHSEYEILIWPAGDAALDAHLGPADPPRVRPSRERS